MTSSKEKLSGKELTVSKTVFLDRDYDERKPINYDYKIKTIYSLIKIVI